MSRPHRSSLHSQPGQPPPRATTAPIKKHHRHIPHHPHRVHVHHRNEQRVPQTAVEPRAGSNQFGDSKGVNRNNVSSGREGAESTSRGGSRRASGVEKERKKVTWAEVERARTKRKRMDEYVYCPLNAAAYLPRFPRGHQSTSIVRAEHSIIQLIHQQEPPQHPLLPHHPRHNLHPPPRLRVLLAPGTHLRHHLHRRRLP